MAARSSTPSGMPGDSSDPPNDKIYIHEFIDIVGPHRAQYMHHMTANWSPNAQEERRQRCFGVWGALGSTGPWPQVINIWEHDGWDGLAASFAIETAGPVMQDPKLEKWWARAAQYRRGGTDRILRPAPWTRPIDALCAEGVRAACYAHELVTCRPGAARDLLDEVRATGVALRAHAGWQLIGAWTTAMANDDECVLLWAVPSWPAWATAEASEADGGDFAAWRSERRELVAGWDRILLIDAPLSPLRTGRQPARSDRTDWEE